MHKHRHFIIHKPFGYLSQFVTNQKMRRSKKLLGELDNFPEGIMAIGRLDEAKTKIWGARRFHVLPTTYDGRTAGGLILHLQRKQNEHDDDEPNRRRRRCWPPNAKLPAPPGTVILRDIGSPRLPCRGHNSGSI